MASGFAPKWCFFWGHTPAKDGSVSKSCFSQWWEGHPFECDGVTYRTAEHFMMAGKARLFMDDETLAKILASGFGQVGDGRSFAFRIEGQWLLVEIYRPRLSGPVPQPEDIASTLRCNVVDVDVTDERSLVAAVRDAVALAEVAD